VMENVAAEGYGEYIRKHILEPTGMRDSGHDEDPLRLLPLAASAYEPAGISGYEKAPYLDWSNKTGNGSLYSSVDDLYRFDRALNKNSVLAAATCENYFVEGRGNRYGWFIRKRSRHRSMSSNGRSPGFTAELGRFPDDDVTIIVLSNSYATVSQDPIAESLAAIVFAQTPSVPEMRTTPIPQSLLQSNAGDYQYGPEYFVPNAKFTLSAEPGYLLLQLGNSRIPLVPLSATEFLERTFLSHFLIATKHGKVERLTYRYSGKEFPAHRLEQK
jgi:CubicO group peptidase (beta-lactamase class C family)